MNPCFTIEKGAKWIFPDEIQVFLKEMPGLCRNDNG
jgi:hypothetical protein